MDSKRFDALARSLTTTRSRRGLARLLGGLSLGGALSAGAIREAAALRSGGAGCTKGRQCKTGQCVGPAGNKTCSCSKKYPKCKQPANLCTQATCDVTTKRCVITNQPNDISCGDGLTCSGGFCAKEPECAGAGIRCNSDEECCSKNCVGSTSLKVCECSMPGTPCLNGQCCPKADGEVPCVDFYCGGCRAEGQPCAETGGGCCGELQCQNSVCREPIIGGG